MSKASDLATEMNKVLGEGTIVMGSDPKLEVEYLITGVLPVDVLLEGGIPRGRTTEIFGNYSTLKSYIALRAIAETQAQGGTCALIDTEHSYDPEWATELGVKTNKLIYLTPETGEMAVDVTEVMLRQGVELIVWDSVAATLPQTEQTKRLHDEKQQPARLAALMSAAMRKLTAANQDKSALLFINQTREKVGVMYGSSETTPGGKSLPFYASYRLALRKAGAQKREVKQWDGDQMKTVKETHAQKIRATLEKSKLSSPHRDSYFTFDYDNAEVDDTSFIVSRLMEMELIKKKGRKWTDVSSGEEFGNKAALYESVEEWYGELSYDELLDHLIGDNDE